MPIKPQNVLFKLTFLLNFFFFFFFFFNGVGQFVKQQRLKVRTIQVSLILMDIPNG